MFNLQFSHINRLQFNEADAIERASALNNDPEEDNFFHVVTNPNYAGPLKSHIEEWDGTTLVGYVMF